ncbi:MAG: alpha-glucosidase [Bacilli bacterium]|jgi:oligo-1,6-glucosidase|nr:alpha-glucosidase [Bacilli bacterium]MCH4277959.1 alpha-glucosidase [Bacilli bacterium]
MVNDKKYFRNHVVYQIYPRSFCDSNGDGIGDLRGIISKLDYLKDLGVGIIWLSPVYKSPNADFGYDVADYEAINPEIGTMDDMNRLILEAKKRDLRIVMDLVVNHTSDEHPWFRASKDPKSPYHGYYYWRKGKKNNTLPPNNWTSNFGGSAWTYVKETDEWYLHIFDKKQPDLDWHNPKVLLEVENILRFWLDKGIYGFRCDVINQIWKDSLEDGKKTPYIIGSEHYLMKEGNHQMLRHINEDVFANYDCMSVGECYGVDFVNARRFADKELDMVFEFQHVNVDKGIVPIFKVKYKPSKMKKILVEWQKEIDWNANYFENHDQLRSIERFGDAEKYYKESAKMLATLLITLRGTPYIYQGEEIGMLNMKMFTPDQYVDPVNHWVYNLMKKYHIPEKKILQCVQNMNRDNSRTPMQWDDGAMAGFTTSAKSWLPVNPNYININVKLESKDPDSILSYYKALIAMRRDDDVLSYGDFEPVATSNGIMAYYRAYEGHMKFILLNLTKKKQQLPKVIRQMRGKVLLSNYKGAGFTFKKFLRPYECLIAEIK